MHLCVCVCACVRVSSMYCHTFIIFTTSLFLLPGSTPFHYFYFLDPHPLGLKNTPRDHQYVGDQMGEFA
jgi:hypothetical protein